MVGLGCSRKAEEGDGRVEGDHLCRDICVEAVSQDRTRQAAKKAPWRPRAHSGRLVRA